MDISDFTPRAVPAGPGPVPKAAECRPHHQADSVQPEHFQGGNPDWPTSGRQSGQANLCRHQSQSESETLKVSENTVAEPIHHEIAAGASSPALEAGGVQHSPRPTPNNFSEHLAAIREARQQADAITLSLSPGHGAAEGSIRIIWEAVFDHLTASARAGYEIKELADLSSVVQRLVGANTNLKALEVKEEERRRQKEELRKTLQQASAAPAGLAPETLALIERQLNLL